MLIEEDINVGTDDGTEAAPFENVRGNNTPKERRQAASKGAKPKVTKAQPKNNSNHPIQKGNKNEQRNKDIIDKAQERINKPKLDKEKDPQKEKF